MQGMPFDKRHPLHPLSKDFVGFRTSASKVHGRDDFNDLPTSLFLRVIPSEPREARRGISTEATQPRARCEHAKLFQTKCCFMCMELQRFCLDPASPCGLLARFASPRKLRLRAAPSAQDDTDGCLSWIRAICESPLRVRALPGVVVDADRPGGRSLRICALFVTQRLLVCKPATHHSL